MSGQSRSCSDKLKKTVQTTKEIGYEIKMHRRNSKRSINAGPQPLFRCPTGRARPKLCLLLSNAPISPSQVSNRYTTTTEYPTYGIYLTPESSMLDTTSSGSYTRTTISHPLPLSRPRPLPTPIQSGNQLTDPVTFTA